MTLPSVIGILGEKEAGKDTTAEILIEAFGYVRRAFGDPLKREAAFALDHGFSSFSASTGVIPPSDIAEILISLQGRGFLVFEKPTIPAIRRLLQWWGTEFRRSIDPDYWVKQVDVDLPEMLVVSDVRFPNEMDFVRKYNGLLIKIARPKVVSIETASEKHASESLAKSDVAVDHVIVNDSTISALTKKIYKALGVKIAPTSPAVAVKEAA